MPKNSAKNITARMSFSLMAVTKLEGMMPITASTPVLALPDFSMMPAAPALAWPIIARAATGSTPAPGRSRLTVTRLTATAMPETATV